MSLKWWIIIIGLLITIVVIIVVVKSKPKKPAGQIVGAKVSGMPSLSVMQDGVYDDNYEIRFGSALFYYTKGDATKDFAYNSTWTVRAETEQLSTNNLIITVLQNGTPAYTTKFA